MSTTSAAVEADVVRVQVDPLRGERLPAVYERLDLPAELVFGAEIEVSNFGVAVPVFGTFQPGLGAADAALIEQDEITFGPQKPRVVDEPLGSPRCASAGTACEVDNRIAVQKPAYALNSDNVEFNRVAAEAWRDLQGR